MRMVKDGLKKSGSGTLRDRLPKILFEYRITPHTTTGVTLSQLLMGRRYKKCVCEKKLSGRKEMVERKFCQRLGPVSFKVRINDGHVIHCHQDQIRARN